MRQIASFMILIALFILLVGSRFQHSDGETLAKITRLALGKVQSTMPPAGKVSGPLIALRKSIPQRVEERVRARLDAEKTLSEINFGISSNGGVVTLRGVVPDGGAHRRAVELAESTVGVESVVDELAVPE